VLAYATSKWKVLMECEPPAVFRESKIEETNRLKRRMELALLSKNLMLVKLRRGIVRHR
jgi:hypothetical protein